MNVSKNKSKFKLNDNDKVSVINHVPYWTKVMGFSLQLSHLFVHSQQNQYLAIYWLILYILKKPIVTLKLYFIK